MAKAPSALVLDLGQKDLKTGYYLKYKGVPLKIVVSYPGLMGNIAVNSKLVNELGSSYDEPSNTVTQELAISLPSDVLASNVEILFNEITINIIIGK